MSKLGNLFGGFRRQRRPATDGPAQSRAAIEWAVAGLGNPGGDYARSRHNAGFMTLELLARGKGVELGRRRFSGVTAEAELAGRRAILVEPETFYNASGECVAALLGYFKIPPVNLIVVHDEMDLEAQRLRIKRGGGDAGNRGVRSIAESLGTRDFIRVRIGLGRPVEGDDPRDYLLRPMRAAELEGFAPALARAAEAVETIIGEGLERAMGRYNQRA
ncbi:MAG TPA: aminoacyl-tRNA hydrolase [Candidatus Binataceae bacterium]|nr:aminoacyl-tRNA hydrolase [Candidatus Binataceae bacterium]